eukprot:561679-Rhodomonas_salina.2
MRQSEVETLLRLWGKVELRLWGKVETILYIFWRAARFFSPLPTLWCRAAAAASCWSSMREVCVKASMVLDEAKVTVDGMEGPSLLLHSTVLVGLGLQSSSRCLTRKHERGFLKTQSHPSLSYPDPSQGRDPDLKTDLRTAAPLPQFQLRSQDPVGT